MPAVVWERQDGLWSAAYKRLPESIGFSWFASGFDSKESAHQVLTEQDLDEDLEVFSQDALQGTDGVRPWINSNVEKTIEPLDPEELDDEIIFGKALSSALTTDEKSLIKQLRDTRRFDYGEDTVEAKVNDLVNDSVGLTQYRLPKVLSRMARRNVLTLIDDDNVQFHAIIPVLDQQIFADDSSYAGDFTEAHLRSMDIQREQESGDFQYRSQHLIMQDDELKGKLVNEVMRLSSMSDDEIAAEHLQNLQSWFLDLEVDRCFMASIDGAVNAVRLERSIILIYPETLQYRNQAGKVTQFSVNPVSLDESDEITKQLKSVLRANRKIIPAG